MSEDDGYGIFKDCLSSAILETYSTRPEKKRARRPRKSAEAPSSLTESGSENGEIDPTELAEFIEVIPDSCRSTCPSCVISEFR